MTLYEACSRGRLTSHGAARGCDPSLNERGQMQLLVRGGEWRLSARMCYTDLGARRAKTEFLHPSRLYGD